MKTFQTQFTLYCNQRFIIHPRRHCRYIGKLVAILFISYPVLLIPFPIVVASVEEDE